MMEDLQVIEQSIEQLGVSENRWQRVAEMILGVERDGLWRQSAGTRNFTVWLDSLASENVSKTWLWGTYRAAKKLGALVQRRHPNLQDRSVSAMVDLYPNCSTGGLNSLSSLQGVGVSDEFRTYVEDEYLSEKLTVSELSAMTKEIRRCRKLGLDRVEAFAALFKLDFNRVLGLGSSKQKLITELPSGSAIDAVCVLPNFENAPDFVGISIWRGQPVSFPQSIDLALVIVGSMESDRPEGEFGLLILDYMTGRYELVREPLRLSPSTNLKFQLSLGIINGLLVPSSNPVTLN
ncbi:MAG: hypothetical protein EOP04_02995 [Proteobacteria bacterium]|nr:MAG: hypothetical protein EOP04_02995 [Pseudomonadota bacterium]